MCSAIGLQFLTDPAGNLVFTMEKDDVEYTINASPNSGVPLRKWRNFVQGNAESCYTFEHLVKTVLHGSFDDVIFVKQKLPVYELCKLHSVASR